MSRDLAIRAEGLGKRYVLGSAPNRHDSLRDVLTDGLKSMLRLNGRSAAARRSFWALDGVSFDIAHGENVGVIGLNGAGKSTLLKILSRITEPTTGAARVSGRVGALLEVGTGFHGDLTGRENTFLYGAILGMGKEEIARKFDAIVEFAGIRDFIDTPVKRYSSGMYVRLAFAVAAHLEPEILLLDEVLSVGDLPFQRKCLDFARSLQQRDATILFVSHNMFSIKTMCSRVIYLQKGKVKYDGPTDGGIALFEEDCRLSALSWTREKPENFPIRVTDVALLDEQGAARTVFDFGQRMTVRLAYESREPIDNPNFIVAFVRSDGTACCNYSSETDGISVGRVNGTGQVEFQTPPLKLVAETYTVAILIREPGFQKLLCAQNGSTFHVRHPLFDTHFGVYHEPARWRVGDGSGG